MSLRRLCRISFVTALLVSVAVAGTQSGWDATITRERKVVLDAISASNMREHLKYIASDELEGRASPSPGLDKAANYIAAAFKKAGLEPVGDDGYFQTTTLKKRGSEEMGKVRNVIGVLRGSDPALKDTYVMVTAHYDHLGMRTTGEGDRIFNGANDDGSGTVSVMELASAIGKLKVHPKRSIVFMTFFGEERGLLGSRYYGAHPILPIEKTIADVNLEQIGRTDDTEGPRVSEASMTGFDMSDMGTIFVAAGKAVGVGVTMHPQFSDAYFGRSDNQALADLGVPAHTLCTAFSYPDYHRVGDHWDKVDYANMAKIDKMVALGLMTIADSADEPKWSDSPKAKRYLDAWKAKHGG